MAQKNVFALDIATSASEISEAIKDIRKSNSNSGKETWMNVFPEIPEDVDVPTTPGAMAVFSKRGPAIPIGTLTINKHGEEQIGIQHPQSKRLSQWIVDQNIVTPKSWKVLSDHPKRGCVLQANSSSSDEIAEWLSLILEKICPLPQTGNFVIKKFTQ